MQCKQVASGVSPSEFVLLLQAALPASQFELPRIAIALSGGSDSFALYGLARRVYKLRKSLDRLITFTVDHSLRPESAFEAHQIHLRVTRDGVRHDVLAMPSELAKALAQRQQSGGPRRGLEQLARQGRFEALTAACVKHNIGHLLLAHHAGDQCETVLMRLLTGASWRGLAGIKPVSWNPASGYGMAGATELRVVRPLLTLPKERLRATCEALGETWYEDATNADAGLTMRNAIRHFMNTEADLLPKALQSTSLLQLSEDLQSRQSQLQRQVAGILRQSTVVLDEQIGSLRFTHRHIHALSTEAGLVALQGLAEVISPSNAPQLESMLSVLTMLHGPDAVESTQVTAAGLIWSRQEGVCTIWRQPWTMSDEHELIQRILWDRRFWISAQHAHKTLFVRRLQRRDMASLRALAKTSNQQESLEMILKRAIGARRFTLPIIVDDASDILALPSVRLSFDDKLQYQCELAGAYKLRRLLHPEELRDLALD